MTIIKILNLPAARHTHKQTNYSHSDKQMAIQPENKVGCTKLSVTPLLIKKSV
jgi:hypothetical protein